MSKRFIAKVPKKPIFKKETYDIPKSYEDLYHNAGIIDSKEKVMLFHLTQFGGFRTKKDPSHMNLNPEFLKKWVKQTHNYGYFHFKANTNFIQKFGNLKLKPLEKRWRIKAINHNEMKEGGFSEDEIIKSSSFLNALNDFYSSLRVGIQLPQTGITNKDRIQLSRFHAIPYLVKKPKAGGRFFHPENSYQRISSSLRPFVTINGKKTSEVDLSGATLQFFNISLEKQSLETMEEKLFSNGDPYEYFLSILNSNDVLFPYNEVSINRESLKDILYTSIYSSENRQSSNVNRRLRFMKRRYKHKDLISFFPEFFNALTKLRSATELPLHMVINKEEAKYAQEVLQIGCLEHKLPVLPIHDSFITTTSNIENLKKIMDNVSEKLYGKRLEYKQKY